MKIVLSLLLLVALLAACDSQKEPFFLTHVEEMKELPKEDLLRMKADILAKSAALPDRLVDDSAPTGTILSRGQLSATADQAPVKGEAIVYEMEDGTRLVRLEGFRVINAPDLTVVVFSEGDSVSRELRGNAGNQNEALAAGDYRRVQIRSPLFDETFAEAVLQ